MAYLEHSDHPERFVAHNYPEHLADLGEILTCSAVTWSASSIGSSAGQ